MAERPKRGAPSLTKHFDHLFTPFRVTKELSDAFKEECYKAGTFPSTMLRELMQRWVTYRRKQ